MRNKVLVFKLASLQYFDKAAQTDEDSIYETGNLVHGGLAHEHM
jgi:hypothetical protein